MEPPEVRGASRRSVAGFGAGGALAWLLLGLGMMNFRGFFEPFVKPVIDLLGGRRSDYDPELYSMYTILTLVIAFAWAVIAIFAFALKVAFGQQVDRERIEAARDARLESSEERTDSTSSP